MATGRLPNQRLRSLLSEAGWTGQDLARAVNACASEVGLAFRYDRTSVSHWLAGRQPRAPAPEVIAETLTRRLGRPVSAAGAGMGGAGRVLGPRPGGDVVAELIGLHEQTRAAPPHGGVYRIAAFADLEQATAGDGGAVPDLSLRPDHVRAVEAVTAVFADTDAVFGGGHARRAATGHLATSVAPLLRAPGRAAVRHRLMVATCRLAYLCGFMCFDEDLHGAAQRYYTAAARLATETGDGISRAIVLRGLSVQARALGHYQQAVQLAESAVAAAGTVAPPLTRAFLHGQLAVAASAGGDRHTALNELRTARSWLERAGGDRPPLGAYHRAAWAHQMAAVQSHLGHRNAAVAALADSLRLRPPDERRSRALLRARLAELRLASGHLERAVGDWHELLDDLPYVSSQRVATAVRTMRARLRPHQRNHVVAALLSRVATALPGSG